MTFFFSLKEKHLTLLGLFPLSVVGFIFAISFVTQVNEDKGDIHKHSISLVTVLLTLKLSPKEWLSAGEH